MPVVEFEGKQHQFPDDFSEQDISKALASLGENKPDATAVTPTIPLADTVGDVSKLHTEHAAIRMDEGAVRNDAGKHMAYRDTKKKLTGGIGHLLTKQEKTQYPIGTEIPDTVVNGWFAADVNEAVGGVDRLLEKHRVAVPEEVYSVLVNMSFNLGQTRLSKFKKMWAALEVGDYAVAAAEMEASDWFVDVGNRSVRLVNRMKAITPAPAKEEEQ